MANKKQQKSKFSWIILVVLVLTLTFSVFSTFYVSYKVEQIGRPIKQLPQIASNSGKVSLYVPPMPDVEGANVRLTVR